MTEDLKNDSTEIYDAEEEYFFIELEHTEYRPGDNVQGSVQWMFSEPAGSIEVRLLIEVDGASKPETIHTTGLRWSNLPSEGICRFALELPEGPYSFTGTKIQIQWYVWAQCKEWGYEDEAKFSYSPAGSPLELKSG